MQESAKTPADYLIEQAYAYWTGKGNSVTAVRKIVCDVALRSEGAFDAEDLLGRCRQRDNQISVSSVYRTLSHLVEARVLNEVQGAGGKKCYVAALRPSAGQSHVVCQDCNQVFPLEDPCLALREGAIARQQGFTPVSVSLRLEANCEQLNRMGVCDRKKHAGESGGNGGSESGSN